MKTFSMTVSLALLALGAGAQTIEFNKPEDWSQNKGSFKDGILTYQDQWRITSSTMTKIEPTAQYTLRFKAKGPANTSKPLSMMGAFSVYDADKKEIQPYEVVYIKGTETELAAPAAVGDTTLRLKDASKWRKNVKSIAFNVKDDLSDLPNREVLVEGILEITAKDGVYELTLKAPMKKDWPAGTKVRQHIYSSPLYVFGSPVTGEWTPKTGVVSGISDGKNPNHTGKWWPGSVYFRPMILVSPKTKDAVEFKDIAVEVKKQDDIF